MPKAPSPPKKSNPVIVWGGGVVLLGALYFGLSGDGGPATTGTTSTKKSFKKTSAKANALYTEADEKAKFTPVTLAVTDAFNPLVKRATPAVSVAPPVVSGPAGIDASITGGEGTWYYTGWVELDGRRQALLENPTTGENDYVVPGEGWKRARIASVDVSAVVVVGPDGRSHRVPILDYGEFPNATPAKGAAQPLNVPPGTIAGTIGSAPNVAPNGGLGVRPVAGSATMTLPNGATIQVPMDANAAAAAANANGNGGNNDRRRGRRNRNNGSNGNLGGFNNVP